MNHCQSAQPELPHNHFCFAATCRVAFPGDVHKCPVCNRPERKPIYNGEPVTPQDVIQTKRRSLPENQDFDSDNFLKTDTFPNLSRFHRTPAPWKAKLANEGNKFAKQFWHVVRDAAPELWSEVVSSGYDIRPEDEGNAYLIAAAPELLAACKDLLEILAPGEDYVEIYDDEPYAFLKKAIAKAEGY